jgi:hypothetical protein
MHQPPFSEASSLSFGNNASFHPLGCMRSSIARLLTGCETTIRVDALQTGGDSGLKALSQLEFVRSVGNHCIG